MSSGPPPGTFISGYGFRAAMDILPVQASAVPCERVFSSSKQTDDLKRGNLRPEMMEMLQILKYTVRQQELSFTEGLVATEEDCARGTAGTDGER
ncbi:hypothetical protein BD626DRAFT_408910 [Schizophyllum amplum]|uniref:HAT C-terminal dimerisation domain-containing protein n=1 Tax=Schizophyllum amplum TaxID=97359 RepID=A0A550C3Q8_9AGAR|nr:hypothetical protein BD626DRAFT_408910 [Auriculariopsis ampla]